MPAPYRIADEPTPGRLAGLTVDPFWPLLAVMVAGFWLSLPWFAVNAAAMGSATRRKEWAWLAIGLVGSALLAWGLLHGVMSELISVRVFRYAILGVMACRLLVAYGLYALQQPSFELHQHFGGPSRKGALLLVAAFFLSPARLLGKEGAQLLALLVG